MARVRKNKGSENSEKAAPHAKSHGKKVDGGRGKGRRSGKGGRGNGRGGRGGKMPSAEDLDADMDKYWGKSSEHAQKKLDGDMDDYWKKKDDVATEQPEDKKTEEKDEKEKESAE